MAGGGSKQKGKQNAKPVAKKKVHAKPAAKKGQPFASLSKQHKPPHQQQKKQPTANHGAKKQLTKEQEAIRLQRQQEQRSFEERMRSQKNPPQSKPMPSFVLAPPTFTLPSTNAPSQPPAFQAFMEPLLAKDMPTAPSGPRNQPTIARPKNVFAVLDNQDDADAAAQSANPFTMRPATFQVPGQPMFHMAPPSFQVPAATAALDDDDDDL